MSTAIAKDVSDIQQTQGSEALLQVVKDRQRPFKRKDDEPKTGRELPPIKTARQLVEQNSTLPAELVSGLLHRGSTMVLGGGSKTNKTFCLMDMALSVAAGVTWWGMRTTQGKVLYLDFELQKAFFAHRIKHICEEKGQSYDALDNIDVWNMRGYAADLSEQVDDILAKIKNGYYSLIIIDPIYKALGNRDENSAGDINSLMNEIEKIAVTTNASVVIGAHFPKGNQAGKQALDRLSGSGVFGRAPDSILVLTLHEEDDTYVVDTILRNFKKKEAFCVQWDFPLMVRNKHLDPTKLRKPGASCQKYTTHQLLVVLGEQKLTATEWEEQTCEKIGMKERTFFDKKKELVKKEQVVVKNDKWEAVNPIRPAATETTDEEATK